MKSIIDRYTTRPARSRILRVLTISLLLGLIVSASGVVKSVPVAYAQSYVGTGPYLVAGGGEGPVAKALGRFGVAAGVIENPWLCEPNSDMPHESTVHPGRGYIQAKSDTSCQTPPPPGSLWGITQYLYRSSWTGWRLEQVKISTCPAELGSDEIGRPTCNPDYMQAFINWRCTKGTTYNYKVRAHHRLLADGAYYQHYSERQTGNWFQDGRVECTK